MLGEIMLEIFANKIENYFDDASANTFAFIDHQFVRTNSKFLSLITPKSATSITLDLIEKRKSVAQCFQALSNHVKKLFVNNKTRDGLLFQLIQIAGGNNSAVELINVATNTDDKTPLKMLFKNFDTITQFFILLMLRMLIDRFISEIPVNLFHGEGVVLAPDIAHEFQVKSSKLKLRFEKREAIFFKIREGLFKEETLKNVSEKTIPQLEQFISKLLRLLSLDGDLTLPEKINTPSFEGRPDTSAEEEETESIRSQLKKPYTVSDELRIEITKLLGEVGDKYLQAKKDPKNPSNKKVIQQYHVLKQLNELITNSDRVAKIGETNDPQIKQIIMSIKHYLEPITVHAVFYVPDIDRIGSEEVQIDKNHIFEKDGFLLKTTSRLETIYDTLQVELLQQMWDRVKNFPLHYDLIVKEISPTTACQLSGAVDTLKENMGAVFNLQHHNPALVAALAPASKQLFAAEVLNDQTKKQTVSASMLEYLRSQYQVDEWKKNSTPQTLVLLQVIEDIEDRIKVELKQLGKEDFKEITTFKADAPLVSKYTTVLKL